MEEKGNIRRAVVASQIGEAMGVRGITRKRFAEMMGRSPSEVTKWLSGKHNFTIDLLSEISEVLGVQITGVVGSASGCAEVVDGYGGHLGTGALNESSAAGIAFGKQCSVGPIVLPAECYQRLERNAMRRGEELGAYVQGVLLKEAARPAVNVWDYCGIWRDVSIEDVKSHRSVHKEVEEL